MRFTRIFVSAMTAVALWATAVSCVHAQSSRLSLAERVAQLEQDSQRQQGDTTLNVDLLNRVNQLQSEVQTLRGMLEEQGHRLSDLERRNRDQTLDFDARLEALEGGNGRASTSSATNDTTESGHLGGVIGSVIQTDANPPVPASAPAVADDLDMDVAPAADGQDLATERAAYDQAFEALKNGQYAEAARRFQGFIAQYPSGDYAPNAQYWLGESYYVTQNYESALQTFRAMTERYPDGDKAADAELKIGYCLYELGQYAGAQQALQDVVNRYSGSTVARLAESRLRALALENP